MPNKEPTEIKVTRRVTTPFVEMIPPQVTHFDAYIYAVVKRKEGLDLPDEKFGTDVRIDPAELNWRRKTITATIPLNINAGIKSLEDLDPNWFESLEAAFLALIYGNLP
jgi:hypothetical protein